MKSKYSPAKIITAFDMRKEGKTLREIVAVTGIKQTALHRILKDARYIAEFGSNDDNVMLDENVRLAKTVQRLRDKNNIQNKSFREHARMDNMILELHSSMEKLLTEKSLSHLTMRHDRNEKSPVGVIQLSDLHFNELIYDATGNSFDTEIASKRLRKLIDRSISLFIANDISDVAVFMTGDLLNSDRRISEITEAATNRTNAMFIAIDILQQLLLELNVHFNVTVASVTGNESRVKEFVDYTDFLASDSYDIAIHNSLAMLFKGSDGIRFIPVSNPLECVVDVNGSKFLLVHGHAHKGLARTSNIENEIERIKARYASRSIIIDYVICGHIHQAYVSDLFSRSSGLPGNNAYSERGLNLNGKSSQNIFIVWGDGSIDASKIDLQNVGDFVGYSYDDNLSSYFNVDDSSNLIIQQVLI